MAECAGLLNRCRVLILPGVRIPPSPLFHRCQRSSRLLFGSETPVNLGVFHCVTSRRLRHQSLSGVVFCWHRLGPRLVPLDKIWSRFGATVGAREIVRPGRSHHRLLGLRGIFDRERGQRIHRGRKVEHAGVCVTAERQFNGRMPSQLLHHLGRCRSEAHV